MNRDRINELYAGKIFDKETQETSRERIHWICKQANGEKILDIGCSQGIVCILLGREGFNCTGVDNEQGSLAYAKNELEKEEAAVQQRVVFHLAEGSNLPFDNESFDTVILSEILEHLVHPEKVLSEAKRVLKDGGKVIITVPYGLNPDPDHKRTYYPISFAEIIFPFFEISIIDSIKNYLTCTAYKDAKYDINKIPNEQILLKKLQLQENLEQRFYHKEKIFLDKSIDLYGQISRLNEKISDLLKVNKEKQEILINKEQEFKKILAEKDQLVDELRSNMERDLDDKDRAIEAKLLDKEQESGKLLAEKDQLVDELRKSNGHLNCNIGYLEARFKHSFKWRIGSIFVEGFILLRDFATHPLKFSRQAGSRFREFYFHINPGPLPKPKPLPQRVHSATSQKKSAVLSPQKDEKVTPKKESAVSLIKVKPHKLIKGQLKLGSILDEFTASCFEPECNVITFRPDNWQETLEQYPPDGILVESAWRGNDGAWQYRIAKYQKNMGDELLDLLAWAKKKKIPTMFWNKEDPPHFDRFIDKAKLFDHIFTSDEDCIPQYQEALGHKRVYPLPFAAQPQIHNPILNHAREHNICFAGTYYGWSHEERRQDMEFLLRPSLDFGLDIYDRQFGITGPDAEQFRFPDIYQPAIKGRLDYEDMIKAYRDYKVFLNVNSVKTSPTMFSRRVFELLACGTPVISTYSKGIEELLGSDLVFITESEGDTRKYLEKLLNDENYWSQISVRGIRKVMKEHTYENRLHFIADKVGLKTSRHELPEFTVVSRISDIEDIENLQVSLGRQNYRKFNVLLVGEQNIDTTRLETLCNSLPDIKVTWNLDRPDGTCREYMKDMAGQYLAVLNAKDIYGANYLNDYALATIYCDYDYIGKTTHYVASPEVSLIANGKEFQFVSQVLPATLAAKKEAIAQSTLSSLIDSASFMRKEGVILSLDRFNYAAVSGKIESAERLLQTIEV